MSQGGKLTASSGPGSGDVVGPGSSTDNDIVVFSGTTGKIIKDTGISSISPSFTGSVTAGTGLSVTTGNAAVVAGNLTLPDTNGAGTAGEITMNSTRVLSNYPAANRNLFLGKDSGNTTNTGSDCTAVGYNSSLGLTTGIRNTSVGNYALNTGSSCSDNVAIGYHALQVNNNNDNVAIGAFAAESLTGTTNTLVGSNCGRVCTSADGNVGVGYFALRQTTTGDNHIAVGQQALQNITGGQLNTCMGFGAGFSYTSTESSNICIVNNGVIGESNKLRIGNNGSGANQVNACYIAGITGVTIVGGAAVLCDGNGQLGTVVSSEKYKENIEDISKEKSILNLRPVQFNYKADETKSTAYGFIAEEVEKEFKDLCIYDDLNTLHTIKYHEMPALLLLEIKRLTARVEELEKKLAS